VYETPHQFTEVRARLCKLQKGCTRLAATSDKAYQLVAQGRWFSQDTPASSNTITGRHDIVEILLKMTLNTINQIKSNQTKVQNGIGGVMISVLTSSAVDRGFELRSGQTKDYKIVPYCFSVFVKYLIEM
jgi:hypothetical protein